MIIVLDTCALGSFERHPKNFFLGDLPCFVFALIAMDVDENNGLDTVEATRLHRGGMKWGGSMLFSLR